MVEEAVAEAREHRRWRILPVDEDTLEVLREYINCRGPIGNNGNRLLFGISREHTWLVVKNCASRAGLN